MKSTSLKSVFQPIVILTTTIAILTLAFSSCTKEATDGSKERFLRAFNPKGCHRIPILLLNGVLSLFLITCSNKTNEQS